MPDALTTITHLINSLPGQLAAGAALAGIVWKFFERVESVLTDQTKLEIAVWLLGVKTAEHVRRWAGLLLEVFKILVPEDIWRWKLIRLFILNTYLMVILTVVLSFLLSGSFRHHISQHSALEIGVLVLITPLWYMACPDSFLIFRHGFFRLPRPGLNLKFVVIIVFYAALVTIMAVLRGAWFMTARLSNALSTSSSVSGVLKAEWHEFVRYLDPSVLPQYVLVLFVLPSFFGVAILIVTFSAVCLLLFCRRFDIGFEWFNRHFDVEKKPLQSIGLVAGALVAVVYWAAVIVSRVVG